MRHADHFLSRLDRLTDYRHLEDAKLLYNHTELLRVLLEEANVPADCERVAISLSDPADGPWVITTRTGLFVTCLANGMRPNASTWKVMPHLLKKLTAAYASMTSYLDALVRYVPRSGAAKEQALIGWVCKRPARVAFEDARALAGLSALAPNYVASMITSLQARVSQHYCELLLARTAKPAERARTALHDDLLSTAHLLASPNALDGTSSIGATLQIHTDTGLSLASLFVWQSMPVASRGLWALRRTRGLEAAYANHFEQAEERPFPSHEFAAAVGLLIANEPPCVREVVASAA